MTTRPAPAVAPALPRIEEIAAAGVAARRRLGPWLLFTVTVIAAFFALIFSRTSLDRTAFELAELEHDIAVAEATHWDLRLEVARLRDPARIAARAAELGMVYPEMRAPLVIDTPIGEVTSEYRWSDLRAVMSEGP